MICFSFCEFQYMVMFLCWPISNWSGCCKQRRFQLRNSFRNFPIDLTGKQIVELYPSKIFSICLDLKSLLFHVSGAGKSGLQEVVIDTL